VLVTDNIRKRAVAWLNNHPDDHILNWLFTVVIISTVCVVGYDYYQMVSGEGEEQSALTQPSYSDPSPSLLPSLPVFRTGSDRRIAFPKPNGKLAEKMSFELLGDGKLFAVGTIHPGSAETFKAEVEKRGGYIKTVVLNSSGGSVTDAIAMGRLIRERKFATSVENGAICASACPLMFAGGVERRAGDKATVGVHQAFAPGDAGADGAASMAHAQRISAEVQKYLADMGVDLRLWVHAMETPKEQLYFLKPDELLSLKLATQRGSEPKTSANAS
jgi:ATP-dependent protease ClpP protease subunit